ncbi:MAG: hypothetical protein ACLFN8_03530 [Candidatus Woesearchaeota archaeon]
MNLQQYKQNIQTHNLCAQTQQILEQTILNAENHPNQNAITIILPAMTEILPFTTSPLKFTTSIFNKLSHIQKDTNIPCEITTQYEDKFSENIKNKIQDIITIKYNNLDLILRKDLPEHLNLLGNKDKYKDKLEQLTQNHAQKKITCEDINLINKFSFMTIPIQYSTKDLKYHLNEIEEKTKDDLKYAIYLYAN